MGKRCKGGKGGNAREGKSGEGRPYHYGRPEGERRGK